ncbi:1-acyl-sn-glycerol-3-phosphate acyltransferase [Mangrovactinospora gilvigrisea]|uniref:1-acyl-sn-glycerol-3-phosphate acyltransferase n=1 Tax=Mangrovactinospora gilvigrisea TaxID=1428644 RepID=A0A1J7BDE2_9ACTN|nr:lysophospholipid acyltransferase family protein [Mangrovactinospora gilvigrisea]OIV36699.1 1-acyl-sn-glycerol-3-phosphate acyltransferase [Mangrovactinospora gilvigrisea]
MTRGRIGLAYRLGGAIARPPLAALAKREWRGMENMPKDGGFITVVNHHSALDPFTYAHFQYNTGRPARFLAKESLFRIPVAGWFMRHMGQIPVYRNSTDAAHAFSEAVEAVRAGECVAIYPEGTLTRDPDLWPMTGKSGAARVALETGAPVIPVAQWGAQRIVPPYAKKAGEPKFRILPRATVKVLAGKPVDLSEFEGEPITSDVLRRATDKIMDAITALLEELRGEKAPAERFDFRKALAAENRERREAARRAGGTAPGGAASTDGDAA